MGNINEFKKIINLWKEMQCLAAAVHDETWPEKYNGNDLDDIEETLIEVLKDHWWRESDTKESEKSAREIWKSHLQCLFDYMDTVAYIAVHMLTEINPETAMVCVTEDYDIFKSMDGNREVTKARAKKIVESIKHNGYIHNPIICNEKMEIIDGQGRLEALKQLKMPVEYIVFNGLTIKECIALNVFQTQWTTMDYIESYADRGIRSYEFILSLLRKYNKLGFNTVFCACTGIIAGNRNTRIKTGEFECTGEQYEKADELLGYVMNFWKQIQAFKKGPNNYICHALMFAYQMEETDKDKLIEKFNRYYGMEDVPKFIDSRGALQVLTNVYNRRSREKIYFEIEYERSMTKKYVWYAKRHGKGLAGKQIVME